MHKIHLEEQSKTQEHVGIAQAVNFYVIDVLFLIVSIL